VNERPFFSVIVCTCRGDKPFKHKSDWHVLDKIVENLERQTFRDFELIIVDLCWEFRMEWIDEWRNSTPEAQQFPVLHIPDKSSVFRDLGLIRISTAKNTGLLYARGDCVIFSDDGQEWSENALEALRRWGENDAGATCRLHRDNGRGPIEIDSRWMAHGIEGTLRTKVVRADGIGYFGGTLSMVPTARMLECNGWDEMFDGARQLEDSDMARRLGATGLKMALEGHPKCIEYAMNSCRADKVRNHLATKCNGAYIYPIWDEEPEGPGGQPTRIRANDKLLTDEQLDSFVSGCCPKLDYNGYCMVSKDECTKTWPRRSLMNIYQDERLVFDLTELRKERSWETVSTDPLLFGEAP
jgi:hypothetical protein